MRKNLVIQPVLLRGVIAKLERFRRSRDFVISDIQGKTKSSVAVGSAVLGVGALAIGLAGMDPSEEADWVTFELNGEAVRGWLWRLPMRNGDEVEVVAEHDGESYIAYAVKRVGDDIVAIYPHATCGRWAHFKRSLRVWFWWSLMTCSITMVMLFFSGGLVWGGGLLVISLTCFLVLVLIGVRMSLKYMPFVRLAEACFRAYGWPDVERIDLRKTSKENRRSNTVPDYGVYYFRYK